MPDYYYQIKGKNSPAAEGYFISTWSWPPIFSGMVVADNKKTAHALINEEYGKKFPLRVLAKDLDSNEFLLNIREIKENDHHTRRLFEVQVCKQCGQQFKVIEKYEQNHGGSFDFCTDGCRLAHNRIEQFLAADNSGLPVIYRITNRVTGMVYIGKTRQPFTLRWWQHINHPGDCKFHTAVRSSQVTDWTFEVVEVIEPPTELGRDMQAIDAFICEREREHIRLHDSIEKGYNSRL